MALCSLLCGQQQGAEWRLAGKVVNTIGVIKISFGVFEISFGVLYFSAGKLGIRRNGQSASCSQEVCFLPVVSPQVANSESELTWGQEFCEVTLLIRYNPVAILSNPAVVLMNLGRILMNTGVILTNARTFLSFRTALSILL